MFRRFDPGPEPLEEESSQDVDVEMTIDGDDNEVEENNSMKHDPVNDVTRDRLVIAIDFGTTFSSVAYTVLRRGVRPERINVRGVRCISNYPGFEPPSGYPDRRQDVPTELWYDDGSTANNQEPMDEATGDQQSDDDDEQDSDSSEGSSDNDQSDVEGAGEWEPNAAIQYWGFGVQQQLSLMNIPQDDAQPLTRFKLNLDNKKEETETPCIKTQTIQRSLIKRKLIRNGKDIYAHYLTHLLEHTKNELLRSSELESNMLVQFVLCVPAKWPMNACRIMQNALEEAITASRLHEQADCQNHDIFMISEPEAAAECILAEARGELYTGETVVILDAGGGTVDAVTYECTKDEPLRLEAEIVEPASKLCGSSYINERFEKKLLQKLASESRYLVGNGRTLSSIVQTATTCFENQHKRLIDISKKGPKVSIPIPYLRQNQAKGFYQNRISLKSKWLKEFFEPSLKETQEVLVNQLELAKDKGFRVEKVILTGGFGQSPSLQSRLKTFLQNQREITGRNIELVVPRDPSTAVARGAVLRALNKRFGPSRIIQCSYGFLSREPYEPDLCEAHRETKCRVDKVDGERYVDNTLHWVIQAGDQVGNMQSFSMNVRHTIPTTEKELLCAEQLWMSDKRHKLHYRKTHSLNKGAEKIGSIVANLTFLLERKLIKPKSPPNHDGRSDSKKKYWEVNYEVALIVEGRSIRFEARWPVKEELRLGQTQEILIMKLVGIAAAFQPGTA